MSHPRLAHHHHVMRARRHTSGGKWYSLSELGRRLTRAPSFWSGLKSRFVWKSQPAILHHEHLRRSSAPDGQSEEDDDDEESDCMMMMMVASSTTRSSTTCNDAPPPPDNKLPKARRFVWRRFPTSYLLSQRFHQNHQQQPVTAQPKTQPRNKLHDRPHPSKTTQPPFK